jgi:hypothetical protein
MHPQPRARWVVGVCARVFTAEAPDTSGIPHAMVLTAYSALSPATNSSCHRRLTDCMASHIPVGLSVPPRDLTPTTGARTTRLRRPQHCRSSRAPCLIAHKFDLALRPHAHTTPSRPPHPALHVRDDRDTSLLVRRDARKHAADLGCWAMARACGTMARRAISAWPACTICLSCNRQLKHWNASIRSRNMRSNG